VEPLLTATEIAEDRAIAEAQMIDVCRMTKAGTGKGPWNDTTGAYDPPARIVVYGPGAVDADGVPYTEATELGAQVLAGKYRIQVRSDINSNAVEAVVAEHEGTYRTATLQLPIAGTGHIPTDVEAELLTCTYDPEMVGRVFNVQAETKGKTHATHRRYRIREVLS
jgi:hypothetical protein